jgi:hypothetical protein
VGDGAYWVAKKGKKQEKKEEIREPQLKPPFDLAGFIKRYDAEVHRRIRLFKIRDAEEVKWDFYTRVLQQECFEKYVEYKIKNWETRPSIQNFERYIFHILRTFLINKSNRQRLIDRKIVSVDQIPSNNSEFELDRELLLGGVEDDEDKTKAPFELSDIIEICRVFPPRLYRLVDGQKFTVSVVELAKLIAEGYTEVELSQKMKISPFMLMALMADLRVVASMLQVQMGGLCGDGGGV